MSVVGTLIALAISVPATVTLVAWVLTGAPWWRRHRPRVRQSKVDKAREARKAVYEAARLAQQDANTSRRKQRQHERMVWEQQYDALTKPQRDEEAILVEAKMKQWHAKRSGDPITVRTYYADTTWKARVK